MDPDVEFLVKFRDACQQMADAANERLKMMAPEEIKDGTEAPAVQEATFLTLRFEPMRGDQLGDYDVAYQPGNIEDKWRSAYAILRNSNATIKNRYHGEGYSFSYWLYGEGKIYRQPLKAK